MQLSAKILVTRMLRPYLTKTFLTEKRQRHENDRLLKFTRGWPCLAALVLMAALGSLVEARIGDVDNAQAAQCNTRTAMLRSKTAPRFLVRVLVPVKGLQTETSDTKQVVDSLFPNWQELAVPLVDDKDPGELMIALDLDGRIPPDTFLLGSLWGFRNKPYELTAHGMAEPQSTGTETSMEMKGSAALVRLDKQLYLQADYEFPKPEVAGKWLAKFSKGSKIFEAAFHLRKNLTAEQTSRMKNFWRDLFDTTGKVRMEVSGQSNFVLEYEIQKAAGGMVIENDLVKVPYVIASEHKIVSGTL